MSVTNDIWQQIWVIILMMTFHAHFSPDIFQLHDLYHLYQKNTVLMASDHKFLYIYNHFLFVVSRHYLGLPWWLRL